MPILASKRPISRLGKKSTFYLLAVGSGIITSLWVILDTIANTLYIKDPYLFGAFEMVVGLGVSISLFAIFHIPIKRKKKGNKGNFKQKLIGSYFDPNFTGFRVPKGRTAMFTLCAGVFSSGTTIIYFLLIDRYEASVIMPFSQFVLIYLLLADSISEREKPVIIEIQSLAMIAFGVIISTLFIGENSQGLDLMGIFLILGPFSIFSAFYIYFQKKALVSKDHEGRVFDSLNLRIWTYIVMTIGQLVVAIPTYLAKGLDEIKQFWKPALLPVIFSMLLVYLGVVFYSRALTMGKMSVVRALNSISVVATLPLVALFSIWLPDVFKSEFSDSIVTLLKLSGSTLILIGMISLALSETRGIILAKVQQGIPIDLEKLAKIKGIESVAFVSGIYDLIIHIKIRNIGKAYSLIRKSVAKIPWISSVTTLQVMKEYF